MTQGFAGSLSIWSVQAAMSFPATFVISTLFQSTLPKKTLLFYFSLPCLLLAIYILNDILYLVSRNRSGSIPTRCSLVALLQAFQDHGLGFHQAITDGGGGGAGPATTAAPWWAAAPHQGCAAARFPIISSSSGNKTYDWKSSRLSCRSRSVSRVATASCRRRPSSSAGRRSIS